MESECDILKSKLILCEWNAFYFIEIAFIDFRLHEIKQCIVFSGTPGILYIYTDFMHNYKICVIGFYTCTLPCRCQRHEQFLALTKQKSEPINV